MGIAALFWLAVMMSKSHKTTAQIDVNFEKPSDVAFSNSPEKELKVNLYGPGWDLMRRSLFKNSQKVLFSLSDEKNQKLTYRDLEFKIKALTGAQTAIEAIDPESILIQLDNIETKEIPIIFKAKYSLPKQHGLLVPPDLSPNKVEISGPSSALANIKKWSTEALELGEISGESGGQIQLSLPELESITVTPAQVNYSLKVEQFSRKEFELPIKLVNAKNEYELIPTLAKVQFTIGLSKYDLINAEEFELQVDVSDLKEDEQNILSVQLSKQPKAARAIQITPEQVQVFIKK